MTRRFLAGGMALVLAACSVSRNSTRYFEPGRITPSVETTRMTVDWKPEVISLPLGAVLAYVGADWLAVLAVTFPSAFSKLIAIPATVADNMTTATTAAKECRP